MSEVVIRADSVSKLYKLYQKPTDRMIEALHPLRKSYHSDFYALKDVSFEITKGETVGIIGANGAGKSTLLKIITGVMGPTTGSVRVNGRISSLLELGAGFNPDMNGYENIYFMGTILGFSQSEISSKVDEIVKFVDIGEYINQPVRSYSSGMMARLGFGVAVHVEPDVLIIDEALSVGDIRFQQRAIRKMDAMMDKAKAILFVSHSMDTVRKLCKRCIWINDGQVFQDGESKDVTKNFYSFMSTGKMISSGESTDKMNHKNAADFSIDKSDDIEWIDVTDCEFRGDSRARIVAVSLYNINKNSFSREYEGGEDAVLAFRVRIHSKIDNPNVGLSINNNLGINIFGISSPHFGFRFEEFDPDVKSEVTIKVKFTVPHLINGDYSVSLGISNDIDYNNKDKVCSVFDAIIIRIADPSIKQRHGSLIIPDKAEFAVL